MKKNKMIILSIIVGSIFLIGLFALYSNDFTVLKSSYGAPDYDNLVIWVDDGSGVYENQDTIPTGFYKLNESKSKCESSYTVFNYNHKNGTLTYELQKQDMCYVYFDHSADIIVSTNNANGIYSGAEPATLSCSSATYNYNQKNSSVEISQINYQSENQCTLNYADPTSKTYLNNYVMSLVDTTQGDGKLLESYVQTPDWDNVTTLTQSDYDSGTVRQYYYKGGNASDAQMTDATDIFVLNGNTWSYNAVSPYYYYNTHVFEYTIPEDNLESYYQVCYTIPIVDNDYSELTINGNAIKGSTSAAQSGCEIIDSRDGDPIYQFGTMTAPTNVIKIELDYYLSEIGGVTFFIQRASTTKTFAGYRYRGANPNNFVWFNNELWRMVGVLDDDSHGVANKNLVKLVKYQPLENLAWNLNNNNDWSDATLNTLLNDYYYYQKDATDTELCKSCLTIEELGSASCELVKQNCNYSQKGIDVSHRNMIKQTTWYLGALSSLLTTSFSTAYLEERGGVAYSGHAVSTVNNIALPYLSDYLFAGEWMHFVNESFLNPYLDIANSICWLDALGMPTCQVATGDQLLVVVIYMMMGHINNNFFPEISAKMGFSIRPTLYLDDNVYIKSGTGSITDPFLLGI